jgi:hypothetical protein
MLWVNRVGFAMFALRLLYPTPDIRPIRILQSARTHLALDRMRRWVGQSAFHIGRCTTNAFGYDFRMGWVPPRSERHDRVTLRSRRIKGLVDMRQTREINTCFDSPFRLQF